MLRAAVRSLIARVLRPARARPGERRITLGQRDIYILPTRSGLLFALVLLAMLLAALNYDNSLGLGLTFLLASMSLVSILYAYRNLARLRIEALHDRDAFAGQAAGFELALSGADGRPRPGLSLQLPGEAPVPLDVPAGPAARAALRRPAERRGLLPLGRCTLSTLFPLGLFRAWSYLDLDSHCLVYPRPAGTRPLPAGGETLGWKAHSDHPGDEDFAGFRAYHPGDSPRHIYWKGVAREQGVPLKQFAASQGESVWLDWEALAGLGVEARLSQLCRWALDAHAEQRPFGLRLPGERLVPGRGEEHLRRVLRTLALFGTERAPG